MIESSWVKQWEDLGRRKNAAEFVLTLLENKFGVLPADLPNRVGSIDDLSVLHRLFDQAMQAGNLDEFRKQIPNGSLSKP